MSTLVKLRKIGGSKGVVLSKALLSQLEANKVEQLEVEVKDGSIILTPHSHPHDEFKEFFKNNPDFKPDSLLLGDGPNENDEEELTW